MQRMLNENSELLGSTVSQRHVELLNNPKSKEVLAVEWEIAILNALAKLGKVVHEPDLKGHARPDIEFTPADGDQTVVADIRTVSDKDIHRENPFEPLSDELWKRTQSIGDAGIKGGFALDVGDHNPSAMRSRGGPPIRLRIPQQHRFKAVIFNNDFEKFLNSIRAKPLVQHRFAVRNEEADVRILYGPTQSSSGMRLAYTTPHLERNPVFQALRHKRDQLKKAGFAGPKGIILCDGWLRGRTKRCGGLFIVWTR